MSFARVGECDAEQEAARIPKQTCLFPARESESHIRQSEPTSHPHTALLIDRECGKWSREMRSVGVLGRASVSLLGAGCKDSLGR